MLVFIGSNSSKSINKQLTQGVLKQLNVTHNFVDLRLMDIPLFSQDLEREIKSPNDIVVLKKYIETTEHIFITTNEHNSAVSAFLKNILDWLSRMEPKFLTGKKIFILSTSEGKRGGLGANEMLQGFVKRFGCEILETVHFPSFSQNFDVVTQTVTNQDYYTEIEQKLNKILNN